MKKILFTVICAVMLFGMTAAGAQREDWRGGIRTRIQDAKQRIELGIENRSITRSEAKRLRDELDSILDKIDRMKEDGLSLKEREKINYDLDRLDRDIAGAKRDDKRGEDWHMGIRARIQDAKLKIERGIQRGTLTRREARKLRDELDAILEKIDRMQRDREKINRDLDRLDRDIAREKHDDDRR